MHPTPTPHSLWALRALLALGLLASYPLARSLPYHFGWENGFIENTQVVVLLLAGSFALRWARQAPNRLTFWFWLMVAPIWFILAIRELSWGAALLQPLALDPLKGPAFSSSQQLAHKGLITGTAALGLVFSAAVFFATRQWRTLKAIWQRHSLPVIEIALAVLAVLYSAAAEGKLPVEALSTWAYPSLQVLEELTELIAYLAVGLAQWRVHLSLRAAA